MRNVKKLISGLVIVLILIAILIVGGLCTLEWGIETRMRQQIETIQFTSVFANYQPGKSSSCITYLVHNLGNVPIRLVEVEIRQGTFHDFVPLINGKDCSPNQDDILLQPDESGYVSSRNLNNLVAKKQTTVYMIEERTKHNKGK